MKLLWNGMAGSKELVPTLQRKMQNGKWIISKDEQEDDKSHMPDRTRTTKCLVQTSSTSSADETAQQDVLYHVAPLSCSTDANIKTSATDELNMFI